MSVGMFDGQLASLTLIIPASDAIVRCTWLIGQQNVVKSAYIACMYIKCLVIPQQKKEKKLRTHIQKTIYVR